MKLPTLILALSLALASLAAQAHPDHAGRREAFEKRCAENPQRCEEWKQQHAARKADRQARRAACEADKDCKARMEQRRAERKARCEADPAACHHHAGHHGRHGHHGQRAPWEGTGTAPAAPPAR